MTERETTDQEAVEALVERLNGEEAEEETGATWRCVGGAVTETRFLTIVDPGLSNSAHGVYPYPEDTGQIGIAKTRSAVVVKTGAAGYYRVLVRTDVRDNVTEVRIPLLCPSADNKTIRSFNGGLRFRREVT